MKKLIALPFLLFVLTIFAQDGYKINSQVDDFALKNIDGEMVSLYGNDDVKGYIVIFSCNHCPFVKMYEDRMIELDKKYAALGYPVIAINPNDVVKEPEDSYKEMQKRAKDKGFTFPYLYDDSQEIAKEFGATRTPHVFVVKKEQVASDNDEGEGSFTYVLKYIGAIDDNPKDAKNVEEYFVADAVDALLAEKEVKTTTTKAIGCTIKWK